MSDPQNKFAISKPLTPVMEDYMEAIFDLDREKRVVRVKDIAQKMNVKMPTVSSMLKTLNERGLVNYEKYEYVEMTLDGALVGREMHRRHKILLEFLTRVLKIDFPVADEEACLMEHALSPGTLERFTDFMAFIQTCPRTGKSWLDHFEEYRRNEYRLEAYRTQSKEFAEPSGCNATMTRSAA